jgi:hypothetical protein
MVKLIYAERGKSTSKVCDEVEKKGIFDFVGYEGPAYGQHGAFVTLRRGNFEAMLRREGLPSSEGYNAISSGGISQDSPTRVTFLTISKGSRHIGTYDPEEKVKSPQHKFEEDAKKYSGLKEFLEDILRYFNAV